MPREDRKGAICDCCNKTFTSKSNMFKHMRKLHNVQPKTLLKEGVFCAMKDCTFESRTRAKMRQHLLKIHKFEVKSKNLEFRSEPEFRAWKLQEEGETLAIFPSRTSNYPLLNGDQKACYGCHRSRRSDSTNTVTEDERKRRPHQKGYAKMSYSCPACMEVLFCKEGHIRVTYYHTHLGHEKEIKFLQLSDRERTIIAAKYQQGLHYDTIKKEILAEEPTNNRYKNVTRSQIYNIAKSFRVLRCKKEVLPLSIDEWVERFSTSCDGQFDPVLVHKAQGKEHPILREGDFLLCVMTPMQTDLFKTYGPNQVCVTSTTSRILEGRVQMTVLMVLDEYENALPTAFCFSNRINQDVFTIFFQAISSRVSPVTCNVFMGDTPFMYDAWNSVMGKPVSDLVCPWYVEERLRDKMNGQFDTTHVKLKTFLKVTSISISSFVQILKNTMVKILELDSDLKDFVDYFNSEFIDSANKWTYCERTNETLKRMKKFENMQYKLKTIHSKQLRGKFLDELLNKLLKVTRDIYLERSKKLAEDKTKDSWIMDCSAMKRKHDLGNQIPPCSITKIKLRTWKVLETYVVTKLAQCYECTMQCEECKYCIHEFVCSCFDSLVLFDMCQHIHAVALTASNREPTKILARNLVLLKKTDSDLISEKTASTKLSDEIEERKDVPISSLAGEIMDCEWQGCEEIVMENCEDFDLNSLQLNETLNEKTALVPEISVFQSGNVVINSNLSEPSKTAICDSKTESFKSKRFAVVLEPSKKVPKIRGDLHLSKTIASACTTKQETVDAQLKKVAFVTPRKKKSLIRQSTTKHTKDLKTVTLNSTSKTECNVPPTKHLPSTSVSMENCDTELSHWKPKITIVAQNVGTEQEDTFVTYEEVESDKSKSQECISKAQCLIGMLSNSNIGSESINYVHDTLDCMLATLKKQSQLIPNSNHHLKRMSPRKIAS